jgi:predicted ATPase/class 3 adenylate cyclase/DNA-binding CsgD family transcriptional regulator
MANAGHAVSDLSEFRSRAAAPLDVEGLPSGTVTFLLTDIEGSTRLWEARGQEMAKAVARHYEILDAAIARHGGVRPIEQGEGDSLVAAFARASDAAGAALDAQRALVEEEWPDAAHLAVRMALHTGEAQIRDQRYYAGPSIIRCARLRALAHGGQVLISNTTADLLADGLAAGAALLPLGVHRLRDLRQPERIFQLAHPSLSSRFPPLRSLEVLPNNLPPQLTSFIGRELELAELADLLGRHRLLNLVGAGGCGKTRLAVQLAAEVADAHPDGVWWVELAAVTEPHAVARAVMGALGILDARDLDPVERITGYLAEQRVLLIFDNCEHVLASVAGLADGLLRGCPNLVILGTSREPLGTPGEQAWKVPPMSLPPDGAMESPEALLASEAVRLFVERAAEARPAFRIDEQTAPVVVAICDRLDGMPLAIELAAARARSLRPERILDGLTNRFRLLTGGARTAAGRQQTLQASVEWSHDLLSDVERVLFRRLGSFSGGFSLEAAEAVCAGEPLESWEVLTVLSDLVDKSLVVFDGERYRLLQTIHDFALGQLISAGEADAVRDCHASWFLALAEASAAELEEAARLDVLRSLEDDHDNLRAALVWFMECHDVEAAQRLVSSLTLFWGTHGHFSESREAFRKVLASSPAEPSSLRGRVLWGLGHLSLLSMDFPGGYGMAETEQAAALGRQLEDPILLGRAFADQGMLMAFVAPEAGIGMLEQAVDAGRRAADGWTLAGALSFLALHQVFHRDRSDLAEPLLDELARQRAASGNPYWRGWWGMAAGLTRWRQGRLAEARIELEAASTIAWELADPTLEAFSAAFLADVQIAQGHHEAASGTVTRSLAWQCRSAFCRGEWVQSKLAIIGLARGDIAEVRRQLAVVSPALQLSGIPFINVTLKVVEGRAALAEGDLVTARSAFEEAMTVTGNLDVPWLLVEARTALARLAWAENDPARAEDLHHGALALCVQFGFRGIAAEILEALAGIAVAGESSAEAARLLGAADVLRATTGQARWPLDQQAYDADMVELRGCLGDEALEAAWREGGALSFEEAAAYASRARGERKRPSTGWASLTPTELEVVALAAQGLSNAQIGQRLFITAGTAKVHLSHIYAKLGMANRAELAAQATARALTGTSPNSTI